MPYAEVKDACFTFHNHCGATVSSESNRWVYDNTVHGVLEARLLKWFAIPFSSGLRFVRTLHHEPSILGGPTGPGSWFHLVIQGPGPCDQIG